MNTNSTSHSSAIRLRIGFLFIFLWWAPFWALAPAISDVTGLTTSATTFIIMGIQTVIGLIGMLVAGKQAASIIKKSSFKDGIKTIWYVLLHGKFKEQV